MADQVATYREQLRKAGRDLIKEVDGLDIDELKVSSIFINEGSTMKRIRPRAKGRANRIFKRTSHISVGVSE